MNPLVAKFFVLLAIVCFFILLFVFIYFLYKVALKPLILRVFFMRKVLATAQILMKNEGDETSKVESLVRAKFTDVDLIRIAEEEILKSEAASKKKLELAAKELKSLKTNDSLKKGFFDKLWRNLKNGKKKAIRSNSRRENSGETESKQRTESGFGSPTTASPGESKSGSVSGDSRIGIESERRGASESNSGMAKNSSRNDESRFIQDESFEHTERKGRYFD